MTVASGSVRVRANMGWKLTKSVAGFESPSQGPGGLNGAFAPSTTTFNHIYNLAETTIAAAGTQALNVNAFTTMLGESVTGTKICAILITATGTVTGGILKIEPHGTNGLDWPFAGTTPSISLTVGTTGAGFLIWQGTTQTVSAADAQWLLTNSGAASITVTVSAVVGT